MNPDNDNIRTEEDSSSDEEDIQFDLEEFKAQDGPEGKTAQDAVDMKTIVPTEAHSDQIKEGAAVKEEPLAATIDGDVEKAVDVPKEDFDANETKEEEIDSEYENLKKTFLSEQFPFDPGIDNDDVDVQNTLKKEENDVIQADNSVDDDCSESQVIKLETLDFQPVGPSVVLSCDQLPHTRLISSYWEACGPTCRCKKEERQPTNIRTPSSTEKARVPSPVFQEAINDQVCQGRS